MKQTAFAFFIAFWSSTFTLLAVSVLAPSSVAADSESVYTLAEVAEHDQLEDCWMVIENNVYDFSAYVPRHPAPPSVLQNWCGQEATEGMRTKGYGNNHSDAAWEMMSEYRIGVLAESDRAENR